MINVIWYSRDVLLVQLFSWPFISPLISKSIIRVNDRQSGLRIITTIVCVIMMPVEGVRLRNRDATKRNGCGTSGRSPPTLCLLYERRYALAVLPDRQEGVNYRIEMRREGEKVQYSVRPRCSFVYEPSGDEGRWLRSCKHLDTGAHLDPHNEIQYAVTR